MSAVRGRFTVHTMPLPSPLAPGNGAALKVGKYGALRKATVQVIAAALSADLRIEASDDGTTWVELAAFTAAGIAGPFGVHEQLRVRVNAYTSSTGLSVLVAGFDARVES